eukprot:g3947.t1
MDETEAVMAAIYRVLKRGGILVLGRNFRHYNGFALASILPLFAPQQLRKDLPVRKTFYEQGSNIDHFYDFLVKQEIAKESQSAPNEKIKTCTSIDGYMRSLESLEEFECNENHLMVVLRGEDAILHGGNSILRGGCWLVVTLSEFDEKKLIALWHSVVVLGASRVFFVPADPLTCRTCAPLFEDGTKRANMLKHIIQDLSWDTIVTYGSDQFTDTRIDPQKKWVYNFVKRHALDKILVFVTNVESRKRLEKYSLGYGTDIGRQHYNMFASWIARTNGYSLVDSVCARVQNLCGDLKHVEVLEHPSGGVVVLVGTAHVHVKSSDLVFKICEHLVPDRIFLELCRERKGLLERKMTGSSKTAKGMRAFDLKNMLSRGQRMVGRKLDLRVGEEFYVANEIGLKYGKPGGWEVLGVWLIFKKYCNRLGPVAQA